MSIYLFIWSSLGREVQAKGQKAFFGGLFPLLQDCLCWKCSDKIRKYWGHIETVRKKENQNPDAGS